MKRTFMGTVVFFVFRGCAALLLALVAYAVPNDRDLTGTWPWLLGFGVFAILLWWGGGTLTLPEAAPFSYSPGEIVPLRVLREVYPELDMREGDLVKRDNTLFRVNSNRMQVDVSPDKWSLSLKTGEYYRTVPKQTAGYDMIVRHSFSERLSQYEKKKALAKFQFVGGGIATLSLVATLCLLGVVLIANGFVPVGVILLILAALALYAVVIGTRNYARDNTPESLIGPEPFRVITSDYGDKVDTSKSAAPGPEPDYQIPA